MALYYVRHGTTEWNKIHRVQGRQDFPLAKEGIEEARITAEALSEISFSRCYVSPLTRAQQTADILLQNHPETLRFTEERIIEFYYGDYEGVSRSNEDYLRQRQRFFTRYPHGEGYFDAVARVYSFLRELETLYPEEDILLVAHGGLSRIVHSYFRDMTNEEFTTFILPNCQFMRYEWPHRSAPLRKPIPEE